MSGQLALQSLMGNRDSSALATNGMEKDLRQFSYLCQLVILLDSPISSSAQYQTLPYAVVCSIPFPSSRQKRYSLYSDFGPRGYLSWQGKSSSTRWTLSSNAILLGMWLTSKAAKAFGTLPPHLISIGRLGLLTGFSRRRTG